MMTTTTRYTMEPSKTTTVSIRLDAYTDHGTGYTAAQQERWLRATVAKLTHHFGRGVRVPNHEVAATYDEANRKVMVAFRRYPDSKDFITRERREMQDAADALVADAETLVRDAVAKLMGDKAAYCTVRTHR